MKNYEQIEVGGKYTFLGRVVKVTRFDERKVWFREAGWPAEIYASLEDFRGAAQPA